MRCPSCNKFPSFEIGEPDFELTDWDQAVVQGTVRLFLTTECCGDEAKEYSFDIDIDLSDDVEEELKKAGIAEPDLTADGVEFDVTDESADGFDRYETTDKKGRALKPRYQKHYYGVSVSFHLHCTYPVADGDPVAIFVPYEWRDEVQASGMEELV